MPQRPFGTAEREVLLKLTSPRWCDGTWTRTTGHSLYESRALTDAVCQGLVRHGYLDETLNNGISVYTVTEAGKAKAWDIRASH